MKIALPFAALFLLAACFQAVAPSPADGGEVRLPAHFCDDFAQASCDRWSRCGQASSRYRRECEALARRSCSPGLRVADPVKAAACLSGLAGACQPAPASTVCTTVFHGAVPRGGACQTPGDCQSPDESCAGAGCLKTCVAAGALSQPCRQDLRCNDGLRCDWPTKTCQLPRVPGPAGTECPSGPPDCDDTATCDFTTYRCIALPVAWQPCRNHVPQCTGATWCQGSTCQPRLGESTPCASNASCRDGLYCDTTCQPRRLPGAACGRTEQCSGDLRCIAGTCANPLPEGASCTGADACVSYLTCDRITRACTPLTFTTQPGGPCTNDRVHCGGGLRCEGALEDPSGAAGTVGTCRPTGYCACGPNAWCDTSAGDGTFTCESFKADGAPCSATAECLNTCVPRKDSFPTCGRLGELGESCGFSKVLEQSCVFPLQCEGEGTCRHAGDDGESCLGGSICFSGSCSSRGLCGPKVLDGGDCAISG